MSEHTPGPWCIHDGEDIWGARHGGPCEEWGHSFRIASLHFVGERLEATEADRESGYRWDYRHPETEANTRLIAAAPDLLAACEKSLGWIRTVRRDLGFVLELPLEDELKTTIAKARGEAS